MRDDDQESQFEPGEQPQPKVNGDEVEPTIDASLMKEQMEEASRERDQFRAMAQRAQADLINYKRRVDEERQALAQNAASQVILRLLPILDNFQRAVKHLPDDAPSSWSDGVHMILRELGGVLDSEGVTPFSPEPGSSFDPAEHEAVFFKPSAEYPAGAVVSTMHPGYRNASRVLRPAQVILAKDEEETAQ